jgi:hypothetical protein
MSAGISVDEGSMSPQNSSGEEDEFYQEESISQDGDPQLSYDRTINRSMSPSPLKRFKELSLNSRQAPPPLEHD